jgi:replicative DNA helicase
MDSYRPATDGSLEDRFGQLESDAERAILGGIICFPEILPEIQEHITATDLPTLRGRRIFATVATHLDKIQTRADTLRLLKAAGHLEGDEGDFIKSIIRFPNWNQAVAEAGMLGRLSRQRKIIHAATCLIADASPLADPDELLERFYAAVPIRPTADADEPPTERAGAILASLMQGINGGRFDAILPQRTALEGIEVGRGLVTVIGSPPGSGKTALASQLMFDSLELEPALRATVANAETSFGVLLRRELARATRIDGDCIRFGRLTPADFERINAAAADLLPKLERVSVLREPCNLMQLLRLKTGEPGLLIIDYIQKFAPATGDTRQGVSEVMGELRAFAKAGWAVVALSATSRVQGKAGSGHDSSKLTQASFRDSSEIEFNSDAAYLLVDNGPFAGDEWQRSITLKCVKNRHGAPRDFQLLFHRPRMEFAPLPEILPAQAANPFASDFSQFANPYSGAGADC